MMFTARSTRRAAVAAALALTVAGLPQISWAAPAATGVVLDQGGDHVTLENGYTHLTFDLAHPQIDDVRADFTGNGDYGPSLTPAGNGIVLERHDLAPANVVNEIGVTDDARRVNGQITPQFSYAAELLPAANSVVTPPDDTIDDVPGAHARQLRQWTEHRGGERANVHARQR
jgi:hypothetical protein